MIVRETGRKGERMLACVKKAETRRSRNQPLRREKTLTPSAQKPLRILASFPSAIVTPRAATGVLVQKLISARTLPSLSLQCDGFSSMPAWGSYILDPQLVHLTLSGLYPCFNISKVLSNYDIP